MSEVRVDTPADGGKIDAGDELVMVDQHTVGWYSLIDCFELDWTMFKQVIT